MSGIFHRRKNSASLTTELDTCIASLHQQTNENSILKEKISDLKQAVHKNKENFESLMQDSENQEKQIQELRNLQTTLTDKIKDQENLLKTLRETKFQLATDKDTNNPQTGTIKEIQDLLNLISDQNEALVFNDLNGSAWEIKKMPQK